MLDRIRRVICFVIVMGVVAVCCRTSLAQAGTQGIVTITVTDTSNGGVPDAELELTASDTNSVRKAKTAGGGNFNFVDLPIGTYRLVVSRGGYATTEVSTIEVHASQTTPVAVVLKIGEASETVVVSAAATPLLDATSNSLGQVIDLKAIEALPLLGRDLTALARLTPGHAGAVGTDGSQIGVWNGQPFTNQGVNIDGVVGAASRAKYTGNVQAAASPRVENIAEMAVQTDQIDLDQGFGRSSMQLSYVTRSGTNQFHGRVYVDSRNSGLNANTYANNARTPKVRRPKYIYNDFGASVGGPVIHDKLFFFGSFSTRRVPQNTTQSNNYLTPSAQSGNFTYTGTDGVSHTANLLSLAAARNLPSSVNSVIAKQLTAINSSLDAGSTAPTSDANIGSIAWNSSTPLVYYWPTARLDYNVTDKLRMNLSWNMSQQKQTGNYAPPFPGTTFANQLSGFQARSFTLGYGVDYQITPKIINQFKAGYLYASNKYSEDAPPLYATEPYVYWGFDSGGWGDYRMSGQTYTLPTSNFYPVLNVSDSVSWQKGNHSIKFGGMWNREQDHYWNPPAGFPNYYLGVASGDPALGAISTDTLSAASPNNVAEALQMYAVLTGRISSVSGSYSYSPKSGDYFNGISAYNLNELQKAWGVFAQDSWRIFPTLTLNYGMRWDFTGDNHDLTGAYHSATEASLYGPSGTGNLFNPGSLLGTNNPTIDNLPHSYNPWNVSPQPQFGLAWNPHGDGALGKLLGNGDTVIRGGYNLRRFTMPQQYVWNNSSSYGAFFYQTFYLNANNTGAAGTFAPGSLSLGGNLPAVGLSPTQYVKSESFSDFTFLNAITFAGMDRNIKQPYTQSWNLGFERKFGSRAIEIRYDGNRTLHQWIPINTNEVNVFENGFLQQFKNAQMNYQQSGGKTFKGVNPTPIFDAAFAGEAIGAYGGPEDYENGNFKTAIENGQVGSVAQTLSGIAGTVPYFCNMVGASFAPCANNAGFTGAGAGYATNFFQANPYAAGQSTSLMKAVGFSNYNSLQMDFRQQAWHGWTFDANYTFGKTLGIGSTRDYTGGAQNLYTLRNIARGYGPTAFDIRHVVHFTSTYDLPFGKGKQFLNSNSLVSSILGNWTVGSIMTIQSGAAQQITGGNATFNDYADGGIRLSGVTRKELQSAIGVHRVPGTTYATLIDPKYLASSNGQGGANSTFIKPNTTPGTIGDILFLYGPRAFYHDMSVSKAVPIKDTIQFRIQGEFLNAWNHPVFGSSPGSFGNANLYTTSIQSNSFAVSGVTNNPRIIELRGNIEF